MAETTGERGQMQVVTDYLKLCRVSNLPTVWTNVLAAGLLSGTDLAASFAVPALSMSLFYSGGMCLNDIFDRSEDGQHRPTRPLPSGRVSFQGAVLFAVLLLLSACLALLFAPHSTAIMPGLVLLLLIVGYDVKHRGYAGSVFLMAGCRFMVFVVTAWALQGRLGRLAFFAGTVQFLYTLAVSLTARYEKHRQSFTRSVIPVMIAGFSLVDGLLLAVLVSPGWFFAGIAGAVLTLLGQRFVRGD